MIGQVECVAGTQAAREAAREIPLAGTRKGERSWERPDSINRSTAEFAKSAERGDGESEGAF